MEKQNTRQAILDAAEAEFLEKGFHGTKTTSIAKRAGVTHAMLHYYFSTKENIFEMFIEQKMQIVRNIVFPAFMTEGKSVIERIKLVIDQQFEYIRTYPYLPKFMINEIFSNPERFRKLLSNIISSEKEALERFNEDIRLEVEQGLIRPIMLHDLIFNILSLNVLTFIIAPVAAGIFSGSGVDSEELINSRKEEIINTITRRLTL